MIHEVSTRNLWRIYALEAKYEFLKQLRLPAYVVPTLGFPLVFYLLFGVALNHGTGGPFDIPTYMMATYGAFGVMNTALFAFGVGVAVERGQGWMLFKRSTPMPPFAHFFGKLAMALLFASFLIRPTPFCILDEIDAPLDEENIGRFTGVLVELSEGAQFMVITHSKQTMAIADSLFGVTMEEPGISKVVSVRLGNLQPA